MKITEYKKIEDAMSECSDENGYNELVEKTKALFPSEDPVTKLKEYLKENDEYNKLSLELLTMGLVIHSREIRKAEGLCQKQPIDELSTSEELYDMDFTQLKNKHKQLQQYLNLRYGR